MPQPHSVPLLFGLALFATLAFVVFIALGSWQLQRLQWKLDLIKRVDQRVNADAVAPPTPRAWSQVNAANDEYRRVRVSGHYLHMAETLVYGSTRLGYGYWVLTPLRTTPGFTIIINRGFIPDGLPEMSAFKTMPRPGGQVNVTGLLRLTEPGGGVLRANVPEEQRWYSRDVTAIARYNQLPTANVAPYFIDREEDTNDEEWPAGGLTVIHFRNTHLVYAVTWYLLAAGVLFGVWIVTRYERRLR